MTGPSIPETATAAVTPTAEMWNLRPALFKLLCWLYATHPIGVPLEISNGTVRQAVGLSESTVSDGMLELAAQGYLTREWDATAGTGRGRYVTTLHRPPGSSADPAHEGSIGDRSLSDPCPDSSTMPETPHRAAEDRQSIPATNMESHDQDQEGEESSRTRVSFDDRVRAWLQTHPLLNPTKVIPELIRSGISIGEFSRVLTVKRASGGGIGATVRTVRYGSRSPGSWSVSQPPGRGRPDVDPPRRPAPERPAAAPAPAPAERGPIRAPRPSSGRLEYPPGFATFVPGLR